MDAENRKHSRQEIDRDVLIELADESVVPAILSDISSGGARLKIKNPAVLPEKFALKLSNQVHRWARIVWRTANEVGLEFILAPKAASEKAARQKVLIKCPRTGKSIPTGMQLTSVGDLKRVSTVRRFSRCPHCKLSHGWTPVEAFVA